MAIKAIIFDCFGVLVKSGHDLLRQDFPDLINIINDLQFKSDSGDLSRNQYNQTIAELIKLTPQQVDDRYWGINKFNQPVIDWIKQLRQSGEYKIGLLSNISRDWMDVCLPFFDRNNLFDEEILSGDVHIIKPNPAIFTLMSDKLNVAAGDCVMIDDMLHNIKGAKQAGMNGILFNSISQTQTDFNNLLGQDNA
jgi:putative hydrolase of the HAD superfamily